MQFDSNDLEQAKKISTIINGVLSHPNEDKMLISTKLYVAYQKKVAELQIRNCQLKLENEELKSALQRLEERYAHATSVIEKLL